MLSTQKATTRARGARAVAKAEGQLLVENLKSELNDPRLEGARDGAAAGGTVERADRRQRTREPAGGQIKIGVV